MLIEVTKTCGNCGKLMLLVETGVLNNETQKFGTKYKCFGCGLQEVGPDSDIHDGEMQLNVKDRWLFVNNIKTVLEIERWKREYRKS